MKTTKKEKRFTEVCLLDICTSDYFSGYFMPVLAIPIYKGMTNKDLAKEIPSEINAVYEYLCNEDMDRLFTEDELKLFYRYANKLKREKTYKIMNDSYFPEDEENEDFETAYIYLSLCKPVNRYGMNFLNE